jgi:DNA-binding NtrC family response regulator
MENKKNILIVEDDPLFQRSLDEFLSMKYQITATGSAEAALEELEKKLPDLIVMDIMLPGMNGIELLRKVKSAWTEIPVIMLSAVDQISKVVEAIKAGAFDYLAKPLILEELYMRIDRALESSDMKSELDQRRRLQLAVNKDYKLLGQSPSMERIRSQIRVVGTSDSTVLIEGETGTGKELVAREIHTQSVRAAKPFVDINCGALPKEIMESELFGYKKGAFTGAYTDEPGKFKLAHGGTLLLDEISEMPADAQIKLLRVIEEREFYPVGGNQKIKVDVRIIACTNKNLSERVAAGQFREDLYYRLNVCHIVIPPLRERPQDIAALTQYFMMEYAKKFSKHFQSVSPEALEILKSCPWKGNVRELRNILERVVLFHDADILLPDHLNLTLSEIKTAVAVNSIHYPDGMEPEIQRFRDLSEREHQIMLLIASGKTVSEIARELSISVKTVSTLRARILAKMNLRTNAELSYYAIKNGLIK